MPITILRIIIPGAILGTKSRAGKVPATDIIDVAVAIIVNAIICDFTRVDPDVALEVWMVKVNTGVDNRDAVVWITRENVPGFRCIDVVIRRLVHAPELAEHWIIRGGLTVVHIVRLDVINCGARLEHRYRIHWISRNVDQSKSGYQRIGLHRSKSNFATNRIACRSIGCVLETNEHGVRIDVNRDCRASLAHRNRALLSGCVRGNGLCGSIPAGCESCDRCCRKSSKAD